MSAALPDTFAVPLSRLETAMARIEICAAALRSRAANVDLEGNIADLLMDLHNDIDVSREEIQSAVQS